MFSTEKLPAQSAKKSSVRRKERIRTARGLSGRGAAARSGVCVYSPRPLEATTRRKLAARAILTKGGSPSGGAVLTAASSAAWAAERKRSAAAAHGARRGSGESACSSTRSAFTAYQKVPSQSGNRRANAGHGSLRGTLHRRDRVQLRDPLLHAWIRRQRKDARRVRHGS